MDHDVIVVGLGAAGTAVVDRLSRLGVDVLGLDRHTPPHEQGSSHGHTRITRQAIGEGAHYTPMALRSHALWRELEQESGAALMVRTGGLVLSSERRRHNTHTANFFDNTVAAARQHGIDHELMDSSLLRQRFPQFDVSDDERGYFEPGAGLLYPEACIETQLTLARNRGARIHTREQFKRFSESADGVQVQTDRRTYSARHLVLTVGPWLPEMLQPPYNSLFSVTRQVLYWFDVDDYPAHGIARFPVFIWEASRAAHSIYGFPAIDGPGGGLKIASGNYLDPTTPNGIHRTVSQAEIDWMYHEVVAPCFPGLKPHCLRTATCMYTVTPDSGFVVDRFPDTRRVTMVSPCSGHGFKHSVALGEAIAQKLATGHSELPLDVFGVRRLLPG